MRIYPDGELYKSIFSKYKIGGFIRLSTNSPEDIEKQFNLLENGKIRNPTFTYPLLKEYPSEDIINHLERSIKLKTIPSNLKDIYTFVISNNLSEQRLLNAIKHQNNEEILKYNYEVFGQINENLFHYSLYDLERELSTFTENNQFAKYLRSNISFNYDKEKAFEIDKIINTELPKSLKEDIVNTIKLDYSLPKQDSFTSEEMLTIINKVLLDNGFKEWKVLVSEKYVGFTVTAGNRTIYIPKDRNYSNKRFSRLIIHEIGVHVRRMNNTRENIKYRIMKNLSVTREEGIASLIEEVFNLQEKFQTFTYLMVCLTLGMDGRKRDFKDIYNLRLNKKLLSNSENVNTLEEKKDAFAQTIKLFRSSDFNTSGVCSLRPKQYAEDNYLVRKYLLENPTAFKKIMSLRYDFLNEECVNIVESLSYNK